MKLIVLLSLSSVFFGYNNLNAQALYMPRNIAKTFANGTRTMDGKPGNNYWQNEGDYDIQVMVTPQTRIVDGVEKITYYNNSPDTLKNIVIRFVNNFHKQFAPRGGYSNPDIITTGLHIKSFSINQEVYPVDSKNWETFAGIRLKKPLLPRSSAVLDIAWDYPLSKQSGREGQIDSTTFYVAYSYPRVSVYDDYYGWDVIPHNGRQEFYNDFNDYHLAVKVPKNYVVWATGDLTNADEVLQPAIAKRLQSSYTSDNVIQIASNQEMQSHSVTKQDDWNTWKFSTKHISDVCFATSNHYVWDAASVLVDDKTGRRTSVQSAYNDSAKDFHSYTKWTQHSLRYFSTSWPGVPYPFSKMTSFQGFADMEYPMMINDATTQDLKFAEMVQDHEIAHTYFPFYMGINETRYAYMDEGWATTLEYLIGTEEFGKAHADSLYKMFRIARYIRDVSAEEDQPIITMSTQVSGAGYGNNSYGKASLSYLALKDMLGDALFKKALHYYMSSWNGKHPIPWDYFHCMSTGSGQNLDWYFRNWFFTNNYIDLKISNVKKTAAGYSVLIKNVGGFAIPFDVKVTYIDGTSASKHYTPSIWQNDQNQQEITVSAFAPVKSIELENGIYLDFTPEDNIWRSK